MSGDFFSQLRRLVGIEHDVEQLQQSILHQRRDQQADPKEGSAVLMLKDLQTDLKALKMESRRKLGSLCDDGGFMDAVPLCQALLKHQASIMTDVETHISKYGYTPLAPPQDKSPPQYKDESVPVDEQRPLPVTPRPIKDGQQIDDVVVTAVPDTPLDPPQFNLDRTPTLEDFGLSEAHLNALISKENEVFKEPPARTMDGKLAFVEPPYSLTNWSSSETIPEKFRDSTGIAITPGLFNGRTVSTVTPGVQIIRGTPTCRHKDFVSPATATPKQCLLGSLMGSDTYSTQHCKDTNGDLSSSIPPVLTTPGVLQISRSHLLQDGAVPPLQPNFSGDGDDDSPVPPVLSTPGMKEVYRPVHTALGALIQTGMVIEPGETSTDTSPIQPSFSTPGLNKKMRCAAVAILDREPSSSDNTPDPPQLCTPHFKVKLTEPETQRHDSAVPTPESPQLTTCNAGLYSSYRAHLLEEEDDDMPATPEMSFKFTNMAKSLHHVAQPATKPVLQTPCATPLTGGLPAKSNLVQPPMLSSHGLFADDDDLPPEPELTCNFMRISANIPTVTHNAMQQHQGQNVTPKASGDSVNLMDTLPPGVPRVRAVTCEEYVAQPKWVQRRLSFDMIETAVTKINALLIQKVKEGKSLMLNDHDVGTLALSHVLTKTKRIKVHCTTSLGTTYTVLQHD